MLTFWEQLGLRAREAAGRGDATVAMPEVGEAADWVAGEVPDPVLRAEAAAWCARGARYHDLVRLAARAALALDRGDFTPVYRPKAAAELEPMLALWPRVLAVPTTVPLSPADMIGLRALPVHPLGLVAQPTWADGSFLSPSEYFFHDLDHARFKLREDCLARASTSPMPTRTDHARRPQRTPPVDPARRRRSDGRAAVGRVPAQWTRARALLARVARAADGATAHAAELLLFEVVHEKGLPLARPVLAARLRPTPTSSSCAKGRNRLLRRRRSGGEVDERAAGGARHARRRRGGGPMTLPVFRDDALAPDALDRALRECGGFFVEHGRGGRPAGGNAGGQPRVLLAARDDKRALAIERSAHFRGWSQMHNERDWREQLHLGRERPAADVRPDFRRLEGPNLWPDDAAWRDVVAGYIDAAARAGGVILDGLARRLGVDAGCFARLGDEGYLVAKLIGYHPQPRTRAVRSGVAAHVDFSWLTINLQDSAGLEVRRPDGAWAPVDVRPGAVWVHAGELLEHATRGRYAATPHRVVNPSTRRTRVSVPVFVNPPLASQVPVFPRDVRPRTRSRRNATSRPSTFIA